MLERTDETIVAVSSAPGFGAIGIVRLTGPQALSIVRRMAETLDDAAIRNRRGFSIVSTEIRIADSAFLPARLYLFFAPRSYTRQDLIEMHTVGSPAALEVVRRTAISLGARPAEPGEFTARAFFNGAMDIASAESVARLVNARTDAQLRAARRMMDGTFVRRIQQARDRLVELLALVEADIDFAEEPIEFITPRQLGERLADIERSMRSLASQTASIERWNVLPRILLLGPPNVGKSSLLNRLCGTSRAICAAVAGTTRDLISAPMTCGRGEAILLDSAGIDRSNDEIIVRARELTVASAESVDLVCAVLDASQLAEDSPSERHQESLDGLLHWIRTIDAPRIVVAGNKCDLIPLDQRSLILDRLHRLRIGPAYLVSAMNGEGVESLRNAFARQLESADATIGTESILLNERQRSALAEALDSLRRASEHARQAGETSDTAELVAFEIRESLDRLALLTGEVTAENLLASVFANFCIGK